VARGLLPATVPHGDAAANAGRAALLVAALTGRLPGNVDRALFEGTADRIHQEYRAPAMPESAALIGRLRDQGVAAFVSGAGPTVLVLTREPGPDGVVEVAQPPSGWRVLPLEVDPTGATQLP
jgi:homoserine kinase